MDPEHPTWQLTGCGNEICHLSQQPGEYWASKESGGLLTSHVRGTAGVHPAPGWPVSSRGDEAQCKMRVCGTKHLGEPVTLCRGWCGEGSQEAGIWGMNGNHPDAGSGKRGCCTQQG